MKDAGYETCHESKRGNTALRIQAKFTDTLPLTVPNPKPAKWTPPARRSWRS